VLAHERLELARVVADGVPRDLGARRGSRARLEVERAAQQTEVLLDERLRGGLKGDDGTFSPCPL
jgi:hypothetical protein